MTFLLTLPSTQPAFKLCFLCNEKPFRPLKELGSQKEDGGAISRSKGSSGSPKIRP